MQRKGFPLCALIKQHFGGLARKIPDVKYIRAISTTCVPSYPDRNPPIIFVYPAGDIKVEFTSPLLFEGTDLRRDELELEVAESGGMKKDLEENPKKPTEAD